MYTLQASTVISIHFKTYVYQFIEKATEQFLIMVEVQGSGALNENQNPCGLLSPWLHVAVTRIYVYFVFGW